MAAGARRAAEPHLELVRGLVVGDDEHPPQDAVDIGARGGDAVGPVEPAIAIPSFSVDAAGSCARAFHAAPAPVVRLAT